MFNVKISGVEEVLFKNVWAAREWLGGKLMETHLTRRIEILRQFCLDTTTIKSDAAWHRDSQLACLDGLWKSIVLSSSSQQASHISYAVSHRGIGTLWGGGQGQGAGSTTFNENQTLNK